MISADIQIASFQKELNRLQKLYGNPDICPINGAGCTKNPNLFLLFMNPTARNVSSNPPWNGIRAPWLGTKNVWKMFYQLNLITKNQFKFIYKATPKDWTPRIAESIYKTLSENKIYITNLAKCTQNDARPLNKNIFLKYRQLVIEEIDKICPKKIVTFGIQVSSILLNKTIDLKTQLTELIKIKNKEFEVYPTYYPVGQGIRNMDKAISRIRQITYIKT